MSTCIGTVGTRPSWMGIDQYDGPCPCILDAGHDGICVCDHTKPDASGVVL